MSKHKPKRTTEAQTWTNVPPYPPVRLFRPRCACGWVGQWWRYPENAENEKHECDALDGDAA